MTCEAMFLAAAIAGLQPGSCALSCPITTALIGAEEGGVGRAMFEDGSVIKVHRVNGEWRWIVQQDTEQCLEGGVQW